jgi:HNH endonuclease
MPAPDRRALTERQAESESQVGAGMPSRMRALPAVPPDCPAELAERMGLDVVSRCERRWPRKHHELGPCLVWTGAKGPDAEKGPYGRAYDPALGRTDYVHLIVWRRCFPDEPIPKGWTVDHMCEVGLCARPDHLDRKPVTRAENTRRRHARTVRSGGAY